MQGGAVAFLNRDTSKAVEEYCHAVQLAEAHSLGDECLAGSIERLVHARRTAQPESDVSGLQQRATELRTRLTLETDRRLAETVAAKGSQHPDVAECLSRCAFQSLVIGDAEKAIALHKQALSIRRNAFGELHFEVANTLTIIAGVYSLRLRNEEAAAALCEQAVAILEKLYEALDASDSSSKNIAMSLKGNLENLATDAFRRGDFNRAEQIYRRIMEILVQTCEPGQCQLPCNAPIFVKVLIHQRKFDEAESILEMARKRGLLEKGYLAPKYQEALAELYQATGQAPAAQ
ncbi:MAG: tetratricopeptide repeat protein [Planctomycetaceae bacterium]|nr:tetratricopeptide repeat protein [Planctomycetaceae bacterium]